LRGKKGCEATKQMEYIKNGPPSLLIYQLASTELLMSIICAKPKSDPATQTDKSKLFKKRQGFDDRNGANIDIVTTDFHCLNLTLSQADRCANELSLN
jgi:hypothetical protein